MATRTEDINNSPEQKKNLNKNKEPEGGILQQVLTHGVLDSLSALSITRSVGSWIGWGIFLALIMVSVCCILIALQTYGFIPKYTEETILKERLDEKIKALGTCTTENHNLNEKLQAQNLLPQINTAFCQPMLEQSDANRKYSDNERTRKDTEIAECKTEKKELQEKIDKLKDEKMALQGVVMQTEAKLSALIVQSEQDGGKCDGWLCSGVKVLYDVVKDITTDGKQKSQ